ncbi:MAG: hypothetical protein FJY85_13445 [Deltaproteobacteria bacterium]|nr:hypothetical protein [Deltaproteobacteria bacterium]
MTIKNLEAVKEKARKSAETIIARVEAAVAEKQGDGLRKCPLCGEEFDLVEVGADAPGLKELSEFISNTIMETALAAEPMPMPGDEVSKRLSELEPIADAIRDITNAMISFKKAVGLAKDQTVIERLKSGVLAKIDEALNKLFKQQQ